MPETTVASNKWKIQTDEFSPACDNSLMLDSDSISSFPMKLNRNGICTPECSACITAFPAEVTDKTCFFKTLPYLYEVDFPTPVKGNHLWSSCFEFSGTTVRYSSGCYWESSPVQKPISHTRVLKPVFPETYGCGRFSGPALLGCVLGQDARPGFPAGRGLLTVRLITGWGNSSGNYNPLTFVWRAGQLTSPFGKITFNLEDGFRTAEWQYFNIPAQITAKSISG